MPRRSFGAHDALAGGLVSLTKLTITTVMPTGVTRMEREKLRRLVQTESLRRNGVYR